MTHSAHRTGTEIELKKDYVVLIRATKGLDDVDNETKEETFRKIMALADIVIKHKPDNFGRTAGGCTARGNDYSDIMKGNKKQGFNSVFSDKNKITQVLKEFKEKDLGISVVVSGLTEEIFDICKQIGLEPHTTFYPLGVWGKTDLLPLEDHLKITTRCGHHMIPPAMIDHFVEEIKSGVISPEEAVRKIAIPCPCGLVNVYLSDEILKKLTEG
jgi:hypothetical protein